MFEKLYRRILDFFKKSNKYKYKYIEDVPDFPKSGTIYIICNQGYNWQLVMECPCGCKKILYLNLMKEYKPSWTFSTSITKGISISPSINRIVGCESHFFIKKSRLIWA